MSLVLLTLIAPAALEEQLTGVLLAHEPTARAGFGVRDVRYHGNAQVYRDLTEQIKGYARMVEISVPLQDNECIDLVRNIAAELPNLGVKYRTSPLSASKAVEQSR